jgi:myo-inositol-1(or 4)-monophosphatase
MAAGILLVREAGGFVSDADGGEAIMAKGAIVAGNETMHGELIRLLREAAETAKREPEAEAVR